MDCVDFLWEKIILKIYNACQMEVPTKWVMLSISVLLAMMQCLSKT